MTKDQAKEILQGVPVEVYTAVKWHIKEGENKCVCTDQPPYKECLEHSGY